MDSTRMGVMWRRLGFFDAVVVPSMGLSGGLCLMWKRGVELDFISASSSLIAMKFRDGPSYLGWTALFTYAPPQVQHRRSFWKSLTEEVSNRGGPWACIGDLNCILSAEEKYGGREFRTYEGQGLRDFMFDTGAVDLGSMGAWYTWTNG
ncbi:Endonuclease/exonuclease/phosphatase [Trema orientale]|uniref:Endonuclease/exonuclease/phosphatase n=1 Tax=Trema orientale TaxID=63057 RepID=A0A2P5D1J7_TREOI|nr:Endonuclease/exonuclease/phosphatase [Trema orientale]